MAQVSHRFCEPRTSACDRGYVLDLTTASVGTAPATRPGNGPIGAPCVGYARPPARADPRSRPSTTHRRHPGRPPPTPPTEPQHPRWRVSGFPRYLAGFRVRQDRIGAVFALCRAQRGARPGTFHGDVWRFCLHVSPVIRAAGTGFPLHLAGHSCDELGVGVRSGKRKRHAASRSVQAAGGSSRNRRAQHPHTRARRYMYAASVQGVSLDCAGRRADSQGSLSSWERLVATQA